MRSVSLQRRRFAPPTARPGNSGFSLLELMVVVLIIIVVLAVAVLNFGPALRGAHVNSAVQITVNQLRVAHQEAMDRRMLYTVTFVPPRTIVTQWTITGTGTVTESTMSLPNDVQFDAEPGLPPVGKTPDGFGNGTAAIDFDQATGGGGTVIFFQPDGTALDAAGNLNDGLVYVAIPGQLYSSHAVSMFGATGRFKTWYLVKKGGNATWQ
jgi:type II secretory pathway pseudopilin PulG